MVRRGWQRVRALQGVALLAASVAGAAEAGAAPRIVLRPVLANLESPVFVTHAPDGTNRLFVVERAGRIKVLAPGAAEPTLFLDIMPRVLAGDEQGLLGLGFHPRYAVNGRFFVNYTRQPDGATIIAEYRVSPGNGDVAHPDERPLLVIPQPFANHNGGMVAFGPDGFLYIGTGDGGGAFDPDRRAQKATDLLGKILRIDVDPPPGSTEPYVSPPGNPFVGGHPGRDEIFAIGLRNPWRFSFDRATGALHVGDVGQNAREEIDVVAPGGNYGWPILEGSRCLGLGEIPCSDPALTGPLLSTSTRPAAVRLPAAIPTGAARGRWRSGAYVFGDFCSGEIWQLEGGRSSLILSTDLAISSFGEDEVGEIYVVDLGGTLHRLVNLDAPTLALGVNRRLARAGDTLRIAIRATTGTETILADAYFGFVLPDGQTAAFVTSLDPLAGVFTSLAGDARAFPPLAPGVIIPAGTAATIEDFVAYTFGASEASGPYVVFAVLTRPSALADGRVDPGDLLAVATETFTVSRTAD